MTNRRQRIEGLASTFAANIIGALGGLTIDELATVTGLVGGAARILGNRSGGVGNGRPRAAGGGLRRRSGGDLDAMVGQIVSTLAKHEAGLRSEELRKVLGVEKKELPRPLKEGLASGAITKMGEKRATVYFAGSAPKTTAKKRAGKK